MNKYLIALVSDSHHLMNEPYFYSKVYEVKAENIENANKNLDYLERMFCLEFKIPLVDVNHLWTCKVK